jgi:D-cysteine desulfhydrase
MRIGVYPTPVERLPDALGRGRDVWVKRDDLTSGRYGGNKVRKLERVLDVVRASGARRIVTPGGAGSHHVLATALYAGDLGIGVDAVLVPQPRTPHVVDNLRAIAARARIWPAGSFADAGAVIADCVACGAFRVPVGGSTLDGALGYADAAAELVDQVARGELPEPKVVVVALGSGGTAAGLAAGFAVAGARIRVIAVTVAEPGAWIAWRARRLAAACVRELAPEATVGPRIEVVERYLGRGYGHATPEGDRALVLAARYGLSLDSTYTAKAFAAASELPEADDPVLYWQTLSSAPLGPLLGGAPAEADLPEGVRALLLPSSERT